MNQKAVLCALQTYDTYQKEHAGSVKYIVPRSTSAELQQPVDSNNSKPAVIEHSYINTTNKVLHRL